LSQPREYYADTAYAPPQGPTETLIARITADVLGIERISREDSFYDFGGTSLQAMRVCARLEKESGHRVTPAVLFDHDVVADLAAWLENAVNKQEPMRG
jgi:acyl carrier protein